VGTALTRSNSPGSIASRSVAPLGFCSVISGCFLVLFAGTAGAQQAPVGVALAPEVQQALPLANSPFALLETLPVDVISDRFTAAGLNAATPPLFGGLIGSWTQTQYRIGDVNVNDPLAGGTPLVLPDLALWPRITIATAGMPLDQNAPALSVVIDPLRPTEKWTRMFDGALSAAPFVSGVSGAAPAVDRVDHWQ